MLHLLDANVLITANRLYYSLDRVPEFWDWLAHMGEIGNVKVPREMLEEVTDDLADWVSENRDALLLDEEVDIELVRRTTDNGYAPDLNDVEIEKIGRDPFLVAAALRDPTVRLVVTTEVSKPNAQRANRKVPDVCDSLGVSWMDSFAMIRSLDFSTSWRKL